MNTEGMTRYEIDGVVGYFRGNAFETAEHVKELARKREKLIVHPMGIVRSRQPKAFETRAKVKA